MITGMDIFRYGSHTGSFCYLSRKGTSSLFYANPYLLWILNNSICKLCDDLSLCMKSSRLWTKLYSLRIISTTFNLRTSTLNMEKTFQLHNRSPIKVWHVSLYSYRDGFLLDNEVTGLDPCWSRRPRAAWLFTDEDKWVGILSAEFAAHFIYYEHIVTSS